MHWELVATAGELALTIPISLFDASARSRTQPLDPREILARDPEGPYR